MIAAFSAVLACVMVGSAQNLKEAQQTVDRLPTGNWEVSARPDLRSGSDSVPVYLYSVTTDASKGLAITSVGLWNRSPLPVTSLRIRWSLTSAEARNKDLLSEETDLISLDKPLKENETVEISPPIASFARMSRSLLPKNSNKLDGSYLIHVWVTEVVYANGSAYSRGKAVMSKVKLAQL
jgi:hypothetical protein